MLAVDPSSPFFGRPCSRSAAYAGTQLLDGDVYIRSMATRGHLGGSAAAPQALRAASTRRGFDTVIMETVGVGQSGSRWQKRPTVLVLLAPGMGDGIQAAKAGILEIGDIFVVNRVIATALRLWCGSCGP